MLTKLVLKMLIEDTANLVNYSENLESKDFKQPGNIVFQTVEQLISEGQGISFASVNFKLPQMETYVKKIMDIDTSNEELDSLVKLLKEESTLRECKKLGDKINEFDSSQPISNLVDLVTEKSISLSGGLDKKSKSVGTVLDELYGNPFDWESIDEFGFETGIKGFDDLILGMQGGTFNVLAGDTRAGKSEFSRQIVAYNLLQNKPCMVFSYEENGKEYFDKLLTHLTGLSHYKIVKRMVTSPEAKKLMDVISQLKETPLIFRESAGATLSRIFTQVKHYRFKTGESPLVVIDHLQLMSTTGQTVEELTKITSGLKTLAMTQEVPLLVISQLNRASASREDPRPKLSDLRGSGTIAQDSDRVFFIYTPEAELKDFKKETVPAELILAKQRNGPEGYVHLINKRKIQTFVEETGLPF